MAIRKENKDTQPIGLRGRKKRVKAGDHVSRFAGARDEAHKAVKFKGNRDAAHTAAKQITGNPKDTPNPSTSSSSTPAPATRSTTTRPAEKVPSSAPKSDAGMKNQNKDYRGNLFEKTFGYKKGDAPDQRARNERVAEAESQANKARVKQGPPAPAKPASPPSPNQPKKNDKGTKVMTLAERMRRRRMGLD